MSLKKAQTAVIVFSAIASIYTAFKGSPEIVSLIKSLAEKVKK